MIRRKKTARRGRIVLAFIVGILGWTGCYRVEYPADYPCSPELPLCPEGLWCNGTRCVLQTGPLEASIRDRPLFDVATTDVSTPDGPRDTWPPTGDATRDRGLVADGPRDLRPPDRSSLPDLRMPDKGVDCSLWGLWQCKSNIDGCAAICGNRILSCMANVTHPRWDCSCHQGATTASCGSVSYTLAGKACDAAQRLFNAGCCKS
jgi:hypothetical protein